MTDWIAFYLYVVFAVSIVAIGWLYAKLGGEPND